MGHLAYFFRRRTTILFIQAGAILLLISSMVTWVAATGQGTEIALSGADLAPLVRMIGVLGVAAGVLITIARQWIRGVLAALTLGGALIALIAAGLVFIDPAAVASPSITGLGHTSDQFIHSIGFGAVLGAFGAVALSVGSLAVLLFSPSWEDETSEDSTR